MSPFPKPRLHPCFASRARDLIDGKTIVVPLSRDLLIGSNGWEPVRSLIQGKDVIYLFFGDVSKLLEWMKARRGTLTLCCLRPWEAPSAFHYFRYYGRSTQSRSVNFAGGPTPKPQPWLDPCWHPQGFRRCHNGESSKEKGRWTVCTILRFCADDL